MPGQDSYRDQLETQLYASARSLDTAITAISTGALVLSIGLIKDFPSDVGARLVYFSWIAMLVTIATQTISHWTSIRAFETQKGMYDAERTEELLNGNNKWTKATNELNLVSRVSLAVGMVLLVAYGFIFIEVKPTNETEGANTSSESPQRCVCVVETISPHAKGDDMGKENVKKGVVPTPPPPRPDRGERRTGGVTPQKPPPPKPAPSKGGK